MTLEKLNYRRIEWEALKAVQPKVWSIIYEEDGTRIVCGDENATPIEYDKDAYEAKYNELLLAEQWADIRTTRNTLLAETDWMDNQDVTITDEWKTYRQALRDLPANTSDPANPTYPEKPN